MYACPQLEAVHLKYGYSALVVGAEPRCNAPPEWKETMGVSKLPRATNQAFYHCIVLQGEGRQPGQFTFVAEENCEVVEEEPSPVEGSMLRAFLEKIFVWEGATSDYLPTALLESILREQLFTGELFMNVLSMALEEDL
eukprot:gene29911-37325_t